MIPKNTESEAGQAARSSEPAGGSESETAPRHEDAPREPTLRPDVRKAFEASWARNEAAYRYLGR